MAPGHKHLILLAALALFAVTPALAAKGDKWIGVQFGGSVPTGDFSNSAKTGFEGGLVGTYMKSDQVGVGVDVAYHAWNGSDEAIDPFLAFLFPGSKLEFSAIQTTGHVLYDFQTGGKVRPYAKGGFGIYWVKTELVTPSGSVADMKPNFGYDVGAGINLNVSPMYDISVGGMYHIIQVSDSAANLFTVGVNLMWGMGAK